ncbi:hypothetical protein RHMOL_Rhmol04G0199700 [Rhododendron molle]|uniref:Uncharacterized protein n=1 Tax=Rhododendron molle TaxID=49168 RepID=A0ACC0P4L3_RHOML|nr:hypothetical protein RHMOL_Rhmol04G0199700 [Rhododendron molle]
MQASQAILRAYNQANLLSAERKRCHTDLKAEREKSKSYKGSLQMAKTHMVELEKEKEELAEKLKKAERELGQTLRREKRKMKEVDQKAYQIGYDHAGLKYMRDARSMVNEHLREKVPIAYRAGYKAGVSAVGEGMQIELDLSRINAAIVPELELPYTDEECAPLLDEEFPESEEDLDDLTVLDVEDGSDHGGEKGDVAGKEGAVDAAGAKEAEGVETEHANTDGDAEADAEAVASKDAPEV